MRFHYVIGVAVAILLAGCQTQPERLALTEAAKSQIQSADIVVQIEQSQIYVGVPDTNYSLAVGGGIGPAMIDSSVKGARTRDAEDAISPLRNALAGYDFNQVLVNRLRAALLEQSGLHVSGAKATKDEDETEREVINSKADVVLVVLADYQLAFYGNQLIVRMTSKIYPKAHALLNPGGSRSDALAVNNTIYRGIFAYYQTIPAPNDAGDRGSYLAAWAANDGAAMRSALDNAANDLARRLSMDVGLQRSVAAAPVK